MLDKAGFDGGAQLDGMKTRATGEIRSIDAFQGGDGLPSERLQQGDEVIGHVSFPNDEVSDPRSVSDRCERLGMEGR
jgi:hypothetical protein